MNGKKTMKKCLSVFLTLAFVMSGLLPLGLTARAEETNTSDNWSSHADASWDGSNLTITTAAQLAQLAVRVNGGNDFSGRTITLGADIDLGGHSWVPIGKGNDGDTSCAFKGTFDGQNHTIFGLTVGTSENPDGIYDDVGLFGYLGQGADVKDTNLTGMSIYSAHDYVGGMAGVSSCLTDGCPVGGCTIEGCSVSGIIQSTATGALVGGLVSDNEGGTAQKCHTCVNITGGDGCSVGGLVGRNYMGSVQYCYAGGNITCGGGCTAGGLVSRNEGRMIGGNIISGKIQCCYSYENVASGATDDEYGSNVGGLVGVNYLNSEIQNCYSVLGTVTGNSGFGSNFGACGGLVGDNMGNITMSFSANGTVTATINESDKHTGGLVGENEVRNGICTGTITNCYFDVHTTGQASDGQLYDGSTFTTNSYGATRVTDSSALKGDTAKTTLTGFDFSPDSLSDSHIWETTTVDSCDTDWYPHLKEMSTFSLNYESNGGYLRGSNTSENYYTAAFSENSLSRATRLGYDFSGWYTDPALTHEVDTSAHLIAATTLYAGWTPKSGAWSGYADTSWYHAADSSFTLSTAAELAGLADLANSGNDFSGKTITLGADIDLGAYSWVPIGFSNPGDVDRSFKGNFDGGGHTITGLKIGTAQSEEVMYDNAGLFGSIADGSVINVRVTEEIYLRPSTSFGGIAGTSAATIENCNASGILTGSGMLDVGGIVGSSTGTIRNCYATSTITSGGWVGGIVGNSTGTIENCHGAGTITATGGNNWIGGISGVSSGPIQNCHASVILSGKDGDKVGGIAGVENSASIQNCCATGTMAGENGAQVGGIVGSTTGNVESCYAAADVTGSMGANVGGLIGSNSAAQVMNCYATGNASGGDGAGIGGFVGNNIQSYKITNCYALGSASGGNSAAIGGFAGNCCAQDVEYSFSAGNVTGGETDAKVGGFTGAYNTSGATSSTGCYFDTHSGTLSDLHATGLTSAQMQGNAADTTMSALMNERYGDPGTAVWADTTVSSCGTDWYPHLTAISLMIDFDSDGGAAVPSVSIPYYGAVSASSLPTPTRSGYTFAGWYTPDGQAFDAIAHVMQNVTLTAHWTAISYAGGGSSQPSSDYKATVSGTGTAGTSTLPVTVDTKAGSAALDIGTLQKSAFSGQGSSAITVPAIKDVSSYTLSIPTDYLSVSGGKDTLTVNTASGSISISSGMLEGTAAASGKQAKITIGKGDTSGLTDAEKAAIDDRPVVQLSMIIDGQQTEWNNPNAPVTVSVPYTPTADELKNPEAIVIWYIDGSGNAVSIPNGHYNAATGTVTFTTTHFSQYAVGYNKVSFSDVSESAWYEPYVSYLSARNIVGGTSEGVFSPDAAITRAQFVTILARMSGDSLSGYTSSSFSDVSAGDWYFAAAQWANKSGISSGSDGKFDPNAGITREQMAAMLYRYAKYVGADVSNVEGMSVREFSDYGSISSWAQEPIQWAINNKIVTGTGDGSFAPQQSATRAQAAKMIAVLLQGMYK